MAVRRFNFPSEYEERVRDLLRPIGYSLDEPKKLASAVLKLSDHYTQNPDAATPWSEPWAQAASLAYYFPLNHARNRAVALEAARLGFFSGIAAIADFGCGMGSAMHAFSDVAEVLDIERPGLIGYDVSSSALALARDLSPPSRLDRLQTRPVSDGPAAKEPKGLPSAEQRLLIASYVLTELPEMPRWWRDSEALAIIEPSTQQDGRRLMRYRQELIDSGFKIWAPCTHQGACPMLVHSEKDWCHDRIHWQAPTWFEALEKSLPMKNRTLTFSYLLARRSASPPQGLAKLARLTGDMLEEKGKTRQSVCRGTEREFLAWFPQRLERGESIDMQRGSLVRLADGLLKKSAEVRISEPANIEELAPETNLGTDEGKASLP